MLLIIEHKIVDSPTEFLLSSKVRDILKRMFTTTRLEVEVKNKRPHQLQQD